MIIRNGEIVGKLTNHLDCFYGKDNKSFTFYNN